MIVGCWGHLELSIYPLKSKVIVPAVTESRGTQNSIVTKVIPDLKGSLLPNVPFYCISDHSKILELTEV